MPRSAGRASEREPSGIFDIKSAGIFIVRLERKVLSCSEARKAGFMDRSMVSFGTAALRYAQNALHPSTLKPKHDSIRHERQDNTQHAPLTMRSKTPGIRSVSSKIRSNRGVR